jgi:hypothetical protein
MQDLQRLERLGSTAALGMWADDVILALDRVSRGKVGPGDDAGLLKAASDPETTAQGRSSAGALAATETALDLAENLATGEDGEAREILKAVANILEETAQSGTSENLDRAVKFFSVLSQQQLVASQAVLDSGQEAPGWMVEPTTLSFS